MKVLQVLFSGLGGHASVVFSLIDGDQYGKWDHLLLFYGTEPLNKEYVQKAAVRNVNFNAIQAEAGKPWRSWGLFYRSLKAADPDLILLHSNSLLIPAWWFCKRHRKKLITVEHTPNKVKRSIDRWFSIAGQYFSNAVILLTSDYKDELNKLMGWHFKPMKSFVIPNGIDTFFFAPIAEKKRNTPFKLGMAARFSNQKDQALLIEVIRRLQEESKGFFQLWLAGDGTGLENVKKLARDKGVDSCTFFTGSLDEEKLVQFFQQLDIYLHASRGETMSTSIMQAMACELPVVASNIPGINNLLTQDTGILVEHDATAFVGAINLLADSPEMLEAMGKKARQYAGEKFSNQLMFAGYNSLLEKIYLNGR